MAPIQGILFDLDGVLIDSEPMHQESLGAMTGRMGRRLPLHELEQFKGTTEGSTTERLRALFPGVVVERHMAERLAATEASVGLIQSVPGALDFMLRARAQGVKLALTTSAMNPYQTLVCDALGFTACFDAVVNGHDVKHGKPDPEPYVLSAARLGLEPSACVVVEDSLNGVRSGVAAGCWVVGLTTTLPAQPLRAVGARDTVASFKELAALLGL